MYNVEKNLESLLKLVNIDLIGNILSYGSQTVVVEPINNYSEIEEPVLIITKEYQKNDLAKRLFEDKKCMIEEVEFTNKIEKEIFEELEENEWYFYYSNKGEKLDFHNQMPIFQALEIVTSNHWKKEYNSYTFPEENLIKEIIVEFEKFFEENRIDNLKFMNTKKTKESFEKTTKEEYKESLDIIDSIKHAFSTVKKIENEKYVIDLHADQFLSFNGKIVCVDPILFNF